MRLSLFLIIICIINSYKVCGQNHQRYNWKYNTITHRLLKIEEDISSLSDSAFDGQYKLLDLIIDKCKSRILNEENDNVDSTVAIHILNQIDSVLAENSFFICIKIEKLSTALKLLPKYSLDCSNFNNNDYRKSCFEKSKSVYSIDCDLGSFIYLGIAECLNLPLKFIEVPKHNFVRWIFKNGDYINWDVNSAMSFSDDQFRLGETPTVSESFDKKKENAYHYLQNLDSSEVIGYYYFVLGRALKKEREYNIARKFYEIAISRRPYHPTPKLCLAYMIVFYKVFNTVEDHKLANKLASEAVTSYGSDREYLETLACSFAILGDFERAIQIIDLTDPVNTKLKEAFQKKQTGIEIYKPIE